jgi:hypothetical protein
MDRRRKLLTNEYEEATHNALLAAAAQCGARVFPKVRLADALDIEFSGLSREEYSYALKAHFDFVVEREGEPIAFAVEFDGQSHSRANVKTRDALKTAICDKLAMPLLRIDSGYLRRMGRFTLLGWVAEVWFLAHDFYAAQERGEVDPFEVFHYGAVLGLGYIEQGQYVEFDFRDAASKVEHLKKKRIAITRPYDPFLPSRARLHAAWRSGACTRPVPEVLEAISPQGYAVAVAILEVPQEKTILGLAQCRAVAFPPISANELAHELAVVDAEAKLRQYHRARYDPPSAADIESWRKRIDNWKMASNQRH